MCGPSFARAGARKVMSRLALVPIAVLALSGALLAQLQPATYASPSGLWRLHVDPIERSGTSGADYAMTFDGTGVWQARHPFTLWEACVTDEGRVGGYGYVGAEPWMPGGGSVDVAVLSPDGAVLARDRNARGFSRYVDFSGVPRLRGIVLQSTLGQMIVRTRNENLDPTTEAWWTYDLRTGSCLSRERPRLAIELGTEYRGIAAVREVPGTPLTLVQWIRHPRTRGSTDRGVRFDLLEETLRSVWSLELPHDHEGAHEEEIAEAGRSALLDVSSDGFELWHVAEREAVSYELASAAGGSWKVQEVGRRPCTGASVVEPPPPRLAAPIRPGPMHEVVLRADPIGELRTPGDLEDAAILSSPRLSWIDSTFGRVLVLDDSGPTLHVFDGDGRRVLLGTASPDDAKGLRVCQRAECDASGGAWVSRNWKRTEYVHFQPDGTSAGIVFLDGTTDFCPDGEARWSVRDHRLVRRGGGRDAIDLGRTPEDRWWRVIVDLAVASDGRLAVLDAPSWDYRTTREPVLVSWYDAVGVPAGSLELPPSIRPGHLSIAGTWILLSSYGFPAWLLDTRDGALHPLEAPEDAKDVRLGLSVDGRELWAVDLDTRTLRRFTLP